MPAAVPLLTAALPAGVPELEPLAFSGREGLSRLPVWRLELRGERPVRAAVGKLLRDRPVSVGLLLPNKSRRTFAGTVHRYAIGGRTVRLTFISRLQWALQNGEDSQVFTGQTARQIVTSVCTAHGLEGYLKFDTSVGAGRVREHCVTYKESPLHFVLRLIEEEGWFFRIEQKKNGKERMVIADGKAAYPRLPKLAPMRAVRRTDGDGPGDDEVAWFEPWGQSRPGGPVVAGAFDWPTPGADLLVSRGEPVEGRPQPGVYEYTSYRTPADGQRVALLRRQRQVAAATGASGKSGCRKFTAGGRFVLKGQERLITEVAHEAHGGPDGTEGRYHNHFDCLPLKVVYRPWRAIGKPVIPGLLTGVVVGADGKDATKPGADVYADEMCRVKVRLAFDRAWRDGADRSVWVRVGQTLAGKSFGAVHVPPIGTEVKVGFEEGDPDRPQLLASLFNPAVPPPSDPKARANRFGLWGRPGSGPVAANALAIDDEPDKEAVELLARKLLTIAAGHDVKLSGVDSVRANSKLITVEGTDRIELKVGPCSITLAPDAITLKIGGTSIKLTDAEIRLLAGSIHLN